MHQAALEVIRSGFLPWNLGNVTTGSARARSKAVNLARGRTPVSPVAPDVAVSVSWQL